MTTSAIYVNDLYRPQHKIKGGPAGRSRTIRNLGYASVEAARVDYPQARSLSDEVDLAVLRGAVETIYQRSIVAGDNASNTACGRVVLDGSYTINESVQVYLHGVVVEGVAARGPDGIRNAGECAIHLVGAGGTLDRPVYALDFWTVDAFGKLPSSKFAPPLSATGEPIGPTVIVRDIKFGGNLASLTTNNSRLSQFKSGMRVIRAQYCELDRVCVLGSLWDGVVSVGSKRLVVDGLWSAGVHRDALSVMAYHQAYNTDISIDHCEAIQNGRSAILLDLTNTVECSVILGGQNSFESKGGNTFFEQAANKAWNVQGVNSEVCIIDGKNVLDIGSREEASSLNGAWGDHHLVGCRDLTIKDASAHNFVFSVKSKASPMTSAAATYMASNGYLDITDTRNYNLGVEGDMGLLNDRIRISKVYNLGKVFCAGDAHVFGPGPHHFEDIVFGFWVLPAEDGAFGKILEHWSTAVPIVGAIPAGSTLVNVTMLTEGKFIGFFNQDTLTGDYRVMAAQFSAWAPNTAYAATFDGRSGSTSFLVARQLLVPTVHNGLFYQCVMSGTSGGSEPAWPTAIGSMVNDGTTRWRCAGHAYANGENLSPERMEVGIRSRRASAAPTIGRWAAGDKIWNGAPIPGGAVGWICTAAGVPGTWKAFGAISN